jgi:hypothetical protein
MTIAALPQQGSELWLNKLGQTAVKLAEQLKIGMPGIENSFQKVTTHDSPADSNGRVANEYSPETTYDVSKFPIEGHWIPLSTNEAFIRNSAVAADLIEFRIKVRSTATTFGMVSGKGYLENYLPGEMNQEGKQSFTASIMPTGPITIGAWVQPT